ncbi:MAG: hypothetical protein AAF687_03940 [Pseudomonadota bacterium]
MTWLKTATLALVALSLGACASISSSYGNARTDQKGQAYYLPKGLIQVEVIDLSGQINVTISGPVMVADREFRLHADLRKAAFADNNSLIKVEPQTQLLTTVNVTSVGRGRDIVENFARVAQTYQGSGAGQPVVVFSGLYEPSNLKAASDDANAALMAYFNRLCGDFGYGEKSARCAQYRELGIDQPGVIALYTMGPTTASTANADLNKCEAGLCYRPLVPVHIRSVIAGTYVTDEYFMIPDTSTVSYFTVPSGVFATQEYNLMFDKGVLIEADQKTQSEVLGFSLLPTKVLKAIISAPIDAVRGDGGGDEGDGDDRGQARPYTSSAPNGRSYQSNTTPLGEPVRNQVQQYQTQSGYDPRYQGSPVRRAPDAAVPAPNTDPGSTAGTAGDAVNNAAPPPN